MNRQSLAPAELFSSTDFSFAQVVSVEGKRMVFCAGQTSGDKDNKLVGGDDLGQQMARCLENIRIALAEAGAGLEDVCRLTTYIVNYNPGMLETVATEIGKVFKRDALPACTLLGVQALALPQYLVEMEATAVID